METVLVVGPGGVGKSQVAHLFWSEIEHVDPHRLRADGKPRDAADSFYANPSLREQLRVAYSSLGAKCITLSGTLTFYPGAHTLFFQVRNDWQLLFLAHPPPERARGELYAPTLVQLLDNQETREVFGTIHVLVLNPTDTPLAAALMSSWKDLMDCTRDNCTRRGDKKSDVESRAASVPVEAPSWQRLVAEHRATEYVSWPCPEWRYCGPPDGGDLLTHQKDLLKLARATLLSGNELLQPFLRTVTGIDAIQSPVRDCEG